MKCKYCGFDTPNNSNFCSHCGKSIDFNDEFINVDDFNTNTVEQNRETKQYYNEMRREYRQEERMQPRASSWWWFLGFTLPLLGYILFYVYWQSRPQVAYKLRQGAFWGLVVYLIAVLVEIMLQMVI